MALLNNMRKSSQSKIVVDTHMRPTFQRGNPGRPKVGLGKRTREAQELATALIDHDPAYLEGLPLTYHYGERQPHLPHKKMRGSITREGEVRELVLDVDDRFAILGGGDELLVSFAALPPAAVGRTRTFLLDTRGYCKDRDTLTALGDSIEPLPFAGMGAYPPVGSRHPHPEYPARWNTRRD